MVFFKKAMWKYYKKIKERCYKKNPVRKFDRTNKIKDMFIENFELKKIIPFKLKFPSLPPLIRVDAKFIHNDLKNNSKK